MRMAAKQGSRGARLAPGCYRLIPGAIVPLQFASSRCQCRAWYRVYGCWYATSTSSRGSAICVCVSEVSRDIRIQPWWKNSDAGGEGRRVSRAAGGRGEEMVVVTGGRGLVTI